MALTETLVAEPPPLREDAGGTIRVGDTRVSLDSVVWAFNHGATAEAILLKYPSLRLDDIYAVIAYYLKHRAQVDAYLEEQDRAAEEMRRECEMRWPSEGLRDRLLARRQTREP